MPASICDVLPTAAALLQVAGAVDALGLGDQLGEIRHVAVMLTDGMGLHHLPELAADAPLLASVLTGDSGRLEGLVAAFPSTTPTSLVSLGTGVSPGEHGVLSFSIDLDADPNLAAGLLAVAGDPRVHYLHTQPGVTADVLAVWAAHAGRAGQRVRPGRSGCLRVVRGGAP